MITGKAEYYKEIAELAEYIWSEALKQSRKYKDEAEDLAYDILHETVDGHRWVIYTHYNEQVRRYSMNYEAYLDIYDDEGLGDYVRDKGVAGLISMIAYYAMLQDIQDYLHEFLIT